MCIYIYSIHFFICTCIFISMTSIICMPQNHVLVKSLGRCPAGKSFCRVTVFRVVEVVPQLGSCYCKEFNLSYHNEETKLFTRDP